MNFGEKLKELIELHGLSQKSLGEKLNISPSTIGNYVRNIRQPDHSTLKIFASFFNVSVDYLLGGSAQPGLSREQELLVSIYNGLSPEYRNILLEQAKLLFSLEKK